MRRRVRVSKKTWVNNAVKMETSFFGDFHEWGVDYEECEGGPGHCTVAIVERDDGTVELVSPDCIQFITG